MFDVLCATLKEALKLGLNLWSCRRPLLNINSSYPGDLGNDNTLG
jgi:hypothetical protein